MRKMRRSMAAMMSGILALSPATMSFADEAAEAPVTYGNLISVSLTQGGEALTADITSVYSESGDTITEFWLAIPTTPSDGTSASDDASADMSVTDLVTAALESVSFDGVLSIRRDRTSQTRGICAVRIAHPRT